MSFANQINSEIKLKRFVKKLFEETLHLQADSIILKPEGQELEIKVFKDKILVRSLSVSLNWSEAISHFFANHANYLQSEFKDQNSFQSVIPISGSRLCQFKYRCDTQLKGNRVINLSNFVQISFKQNISNLNLLKATSDLYEQAITAENGLIILACPRHEDLKPSLSFLLSASDAIYAGDLDQGLHNQDLILAKQNKIVLTTKASDPIAVLLKLRQLDLDPEEICLQSIICQGFAARTCSACAKEAVIDTKLIEKLPDSLRPDKSIKYLVGRGCNKCQLTGVSGQIAISSIVLVSNDQQLIKYCKERATDSQLTEHLYAKGLRCLVENGLKNILLGLTSFESVYKVAHLIPESYLKIIERYNSHVDQTEIKLIDADFSSTTVIEKPLQGRAAFSTRPEDNKPLFANIVNQKVRNKPLLMVVEDDPDQREILEMVLRSSNYDVCLAGDGAEAINVAKRDLPDLIISDLMMPKMDGHEFVTKMKRDGELKKIPILMLTVVSDTEHEYGLLEEGADDYCEKTIQRKILLKRIENLLKRTRPTV